MRTRIAIAALILLVMGGCSKPDTMLSAMVPASARAVVYSTESSASKGVTYEVTSSPGSYEFLTPLRTKLKAAGYELCKKSAVSIWAPAPARRPDAAFKDVWVDELYTTDKHEKFFVVKVIARPNADGAAWTQQFSLAFQSVPVGRQDFSSIREFCD